MKRVAIIGGGIAGLSAAYYLEKARQGGAEIAWTLFEKSDRLGGVIRTEHRDGFVLEAGPDSFLTAKPDAAQLCRELGIGDQIIPSNDFQRRTYIVVKGKLVPLPDGLQFMVPTRILPMVTTGLFSFGTKLRMAGEWFAAAGNHKQDESVAQFVRRHFGQEMVDRVAEPLLAGVYGGNAEHLSVSAVLPRFVEMERQQGSLVRATLKARKAAPPSAAPQPLFTSLKNGLQDLVNTLTGILPNASMRLRTQVTSLKPVDGRWYIGTSGEVDIFDAVLLAVPATFAAALMALVNSEITGRLEKIQYTSSAAVALAFENPSLLPGFGFLVPGSEGRKMLACTFVHNKFSYRAPEGQALLRCFFSSSRVPDLLQYSEDDLKAIAMKEVKEILNLNAQPKFTRVFRWTHALPQYETGHLQRAAEIEAQLATLPGLQLIGNSLYGVGIPDCIRSAKLAVPKIVG
jgi:protoporphyrinogen/coproporphyrinogen III oxidase